MTHQEPTHSRVARHRWRRKADTCPADHPVRIPQVTAHADFVNGWTQARFDTAFATCVTGGKACGRMSGPDTTPAHPDALVNPAKAKQQMSSAAARPTR